MSRVRSPSVFGLLFGIPLACGAQTPEPHSPDQWLARIAQAGSHLEYQGVLVYAHDGRVDAMHIARSLGPQGPREEIVALNGERRQIVRENGSVRFADAEHGTTEVGRDEFPLLTFDAAQLSRAAELYRLSLLGADRIAGLDARVLAARPIDSSRYGYKLWVEPASGMVLGSTLENPDGGQVEQMMFTSVALSNAKQPVPTTAPAPAPTTAMAALTPTAWRMGWLPPGFRLIGAPATATARSHLLFSDGMAYVSVYIEPVPSNVQPIDGPTKRGAMNLYARPVDGNQVVVIGDVPPQTAERIARGVERAAQK